MRVRYYVLARELQFEVFRESVSKSSHTIHARAIDAARTMARLEARLARTPTQVLVEDEQGQLRIEAEYELVDAVRPTRKSAVA